MASTTPISDPRDTVIAPKSGAALVVRTGETLRVTDLEGHQVADFPIESAQVVEHVQNPAQRL